MQKRGRTSKLNEQQRLTALEITYDTGSPDPYIELIRDSAISANVKYVRTEY